MGGLPGVRMTELCVLAIDSRQKGVMDGTGVLLGLTVVHVGDQDCGYHHWSGLLFVDGLGHPGGA